MNPIIKKSIRIQLICVIAGASIISALISSIGHYTFTSSFLKNSVNQQVSSALQFTSDLLTNQYSTYITHDLELLKSLPEIQQLATNNEEHIRYDTSKIPLLLNKLIKSSNGKYEAIIITDSSGKIVTIANKNNAGAPTGETTDYNFNRAIDPIKFGASEVFAKINKNNTEIIFSGPAKQKDSYLFFSGTSIGDKKNEKIYGSIIIAFNINNLIKTLDEVKVLETPVAWLFTNNGEKIHGPTSEKNLDPRPYIFDKNEKPSNLVIRKNNTSKTNSLNHILYIVISLPPHIARELSNNSILLTALVLMGIIIVVLLVAYITAKRIVLPIHKLTSLSQKVAAGDFNVRMPTERSDEIGILSKAFNIMIQELEEQRYELQSLANKDTLTQLPNRRQFEQHLSVLIKSCDRNKRSIAVMYIDLDQFKDTNDTFGHPAGDKLIRDVSSRLLKTVRQSDLVARLGGDEFAIILNPHKTRSDTEYVAKKILSELNEPFLIEKHQIFSGGSIGISIYPEHGRNATELVKNADAAMYKAKSSGRNNYQFYLENLTTKANERLVLGSMIRNAIVNNELTIHYQPKVNLISKKVVGAEALLRWQYKGQTILPSKIISIAETSGFIEKIDAWVINKVCLQIKEWEDNNLPILPISINISGRLLEKNKVITLLKKVLHKYALDPKWIEIEITENDLISNHQQTQKALKIIHSLGVKVAIDDFGTGYSSLSYLKDLLVDTLKIDRKFVVNAMINHADKEIASAIVKLARSLQLHIVVEGIETIEQEEFFKNLGAQSAQGYLYAKAMNTEQFINHLSKNQEIPYQTNLLSKNNSFTNIRN